MTPIILQYGHSIREIVWLERNKQYHVRYDPTLIQYVKENKLYVLHITPYKKKILTKHKRKFYAVAWPKNADLIYKMFQQGSNYYQIFQTLDL